MGLSTLRCLSSGALSLIGHPPPDPLTGPSFVTEAASRPFFEVTEALRSPLGRRFLVEAMREAEVRTATGFGQLITDPRLSLRKMSRRTFGRALLLLLARTRLPWYLLAALLAPKAQSRRVQHFVEHLRLAHQIDTSADATAHLAEASRLLLHCLRLAFRVSPVMIAGMLSFTLASQEDAR
jgi:pyruvate,water dikinase